MTLAAPLEDLEETREAAASPAYDLDRVRADFPILAQKVHGRPLGHHQQGR